MSDWFRFVGPNHALEILGVRLVGINATNGKKLLFSVIFALVVLLMGAGLRGLARLVLFGRRNDRLRFWLRQGLKLGTAVVLVIGLLSIWFDDPNRLATALGLITAGVAFALQRVITAFAGYIVVLRGNTFSVGDRITMGGVRGDVLALGFMQTTIMEMGQPPGEQTDPPAMWVQARQYTGRIVTVTNDKIFHEPVYNYTRVFPYLWEEMHLPIRYAADYQRAEAVLLEVAERHTLKISELGEDALAEMQRRYLMRRSELKPRVYYRLTDNWVELSLRFLSLDSQVRELKDAMSRDILHAFAAAGIDIASSTSELVGLPPLRIESISGAVPLAAQQNGQ